MTATNSARADDIPPATLKFITAIASDCTQFDVQAIQTVRFRDPMETGTQAGEITLYQVPCNGGAYNIFDRWVLKDPYGALMPLSFATPVFKTEYEDPSEGAKLKSISVTSFTAVADIGASSFDPKTLTLTSFFKKRGLGDAHESGAWTFENGTFVLQRYTVDPTYDGAVNPITIWSRDDSNP
ncbi:MAG: DUF1176 domain-containing protein [Pseudomonadota bacterium]